MAVFSMHRVREEGKAAAYWSEVATAEFPELGPGPRSGVKPATVLAAGLTALFDHHHIGAGRALRLRALALLYQDHHDLAHDLVQDLSDSDGAMIHAILHRREPDYWNAKYWFRRCEGHSVFVKLAPEVSAAAASTAERAVADRLTLSGSFDPFAFIDECERTAPRGEANVEASWLRRVQDLEFHALARLLLA